MKNIFVIQILILLALTDITSQNFKKESGKNEFSQAKPLNNLIERTIYYFDNNDIDSSVFSNDTVVLFKNKLNYQSPRIIFEQDLKFCFSYNIRLDTIRKADHQTGIVITQLVESKYDIKGSYEFFRIMKSRDDIKKEILSLEFEDGKTIHYCWKENKDQVMLIKKK